MGPFPHDSDKHAEFAESLTPAMLKALPKLAEIFLLGDKLPRPLLRQRLVKAVSRVACRFVQDRCQLFFMKPLSAFYDVFDVFLRDLNGSLFAAVRDC